MPRRQPSLDANVNAICSPQTPKRSTNNNHTFNSLPRPAKPANMKAVEIDNSKIVNGDYEMIAGYVYIKCEITP
jgi:hypothetical protein